MDIKLTTTDVQVIEDILLKALEEKDFIKNVFAIDNELDLEIQKAGVISIIEKFSFPITVVGVEKELSVQ